MNWVLKYGDILREPADVLVCSGNVFLNLSGGVGGEILLRCGDAMQCELHDTLKNRGIRFVERGEVVKTSACGLPFKAALHAVAVNGFYESSPAVIGKTVSNALREAAGLGAQRVALTALATGFGRMSMRQFAEGNLPLLSEEFPPVREVVICVLKEFERDELATALPGAVVVK
jgi:O-acetyl-ADP-ribose deacetylase (regulator of RNase III)